MPVLGLLMAMCCAAQPVAVTVDATTNLVLGDQATIAGTLFGVTAFEGFSEVIANADYRARVMAAGFGSFRFPAPADWYAPEGAKPEWFDTPEAQTILEQTMAFGARYPLTRFLRTSRWLGAEPIVQLSVGEKLTKLDAAGVPLDFEAWTKWAVAMAGAAKKADPALRLVQIWNEPNANWWKSDERLKPMGGWVGAHDKLFNLAARAIKAKYPDMLVVGPVFCWPPTWPPNRVGPSWGTWEEFTVPFLRDCAETADFFDFHSYNVTGDEVQTQLEMIAAASERMRGRRLQSWITESGYDVPEAEWGKPAEWMKRAIPYERFLWGLLGQTDKCVGNLAHDLHAGAFRVVPSPAEGEPRPEYQVFWILRDLRGARLLTACDDGAVKVAATTHDDFLNTVCFNDSDQARHVSIKAAVPAGWWTGPEVRALLPTGDRATFKTGTVDVKMTRNPGEAVLEFDLPALATVSILLRPQYFLKPARKVVVREVFARPEMLDISKAVGKVVATMPADVGEAKLRVGLLGPSEKCKVVAKVGGKSYDLAPTAWQEIAIGPVAKGEQTIEVSASGEVPGNLRLGFAAITWREVTPAR